MANIFDTDKESVLDVLCKVSYPMCKRVLYTYANIVLKDMVQAGMPETEAKKLIKTSLKKTLKISASINQECMGVMHGTMSNLQASDGKGRDVLGKIITSYAFTKNGSKTTIPMPGSELDMQSRKKYMDGVLPVPLLEYFLASIRGSVQGVDKFRAIPVLFGTMDIRVSEIREKLETVLEDYELSEELENSPVFWEGMLLDNRTKACALEFTDLILDRIRKLGAEHYVKILENLRQKYREKTGCSRMKRGFTEQEILLIVTALEDARTFLQN